MLTGISAFYGIGYVDIMEMPVGLRRRYYLEIPRWQAERNLQSAIVALLPNAGKQGQATMHQWQVTARWMRENTATGIRNLRRLIERFATPKIERGRDGGE